MQLRHTYIIHAAFVRIAEIYYFRSRNIREFLANFAEVRESLRREKFYIDRFAKVYAREIFQFFFLQTCWLLLIMR